MSSAIQLGLLLSSAILGGQMPALADQSLLIGRSPLYAQDIAIASISASDFPHPDPSAFFSDYPSFNSQRLDQQLVLYSRYLATVGRPDVLIVGSSRSLQGIDPTALQAALAAQGYPNLTIYNFGVNGATAQVVDLIVRRILTADQLPRLIIWADGSRAFNSGRQDVTYNGIVASEGYRSLNRGDRPIPTLSQPTIPSDELCLDLPRNHTLNASGTHTLQSNPELASVDIELADLALALQPHHSDCDLAEPTPRESFANHDRFTSYVYVNQPGSSELDATGFQPVSTEFNPATYYRQYPRVAGQYDSSYVPFRLNGEQNTAAIALSRYIKHQQIPLVFVNLPLSHDYLDPVRQQYERQFQEYMQQLAAQEGFIFSNLMGEIANQNHYFADPSHLNRHGAQAIAQEIAVDPGIPWEILRR